MTKRGLEILKKKEVYKLGFPMQKNRDSYLYCSDVLPERCYRLIECTDECKTRIFYAFGCL